MTAACVAPIADETMVDYWSGGLPAAAVRGARGARLQLRSLRGPARRGRLDGRRHHVAGAAGPGSPASSRARR